jgi:hypothetical protein
MEPLGALNRLNETAGSFMVTQTFATACNLGVFEQLFASGRAVDCSG